LISEGDQAEVEKLINDGTNPDKRDEQTSSTEISETETN